MKGNYSGALDAYSRAFDIEEQNMKENNLKSSYRTNTSKSKEKFRMSYDIKI